MRKLITLPNMLTAQRIVGAVVLFFISPLSVAFFVIYSICGVSDVLDGTVARARHATTEFGAKLDSCADLLFYAAMILRIFPILWERLPRLIWVFVALALVLRVSSYLTAALKFHKFAALHTYMNKLTGLAVFMIPYFIAGNYGVVYCCIACAIGIFASAEELLIHIIRREYKAGIMSLCDIIPKTDHKNKSTDN